MPEIMTALGEIPAQELGLTSMHEHILYDGRIYRQRYASLFPPQLPVMADDPIRLDNIGLLRHIPVLTWDAVSMQDEKAMLGEMADYKASGGCSMLDMSAPGLRCDLKAIQRISQKTGVHVVATTGFYTQDSWPERFQQMTIDQFYQHMMREIEEGIEDTGIRAGHIKVAVEGGLNEMERRVIVAAARAVNQSGLSMTIHQGLGIGGPEAFRMIEILRQEGVDLARVIFAHVQGTFAERNLKNLVMDPSTWTLRLDYAKQLLAEGVNISIDCFGHQWDGEFIGFILESEWQRLAGLVALLKERRACQIVLGTDTYLKILTRRFGGEGYCRLTNFVIPTLRQLGISDGDIHLMMVENPAKLLSRS